MRIALKGNNTTYCATYLSDGSRNRGIGLWVKNRDGALNCVVRLWPTEDGENMLVVDPAMLEKAGVRLFVQKDENEIAEAVIKEKIG